MRATNIKNNTALTITATYVNSTSAANAVAQISGKYAQITEDGTIFEVNTSPREIIREIKCQLAR